MAKNSEISDFQLKKKHICTKNCALKKIAVRTIHVLTISCEFWRNNSIFMKKKSVFKTISCEKSSCFDS